MHVAATQAVLDAIRSRGVRRYVHMSALGTRENAASEYHRTKWEAEQRVRASKLDWTILRPSMIHGRGGELMEMEARWARGQAAPWLFMPYFGAGWLGAGGAGLLQPIWIKDVARAFVDCLTNARTVGRTYELGGADRVTWPEMHKTVSAAVTGRAKRAAPIPAWFARVLTHIVPGAILPFNRAQVVMSQQDNICDLSPFVDDFGWSPDGFAQSLARYQNKL
jgi:NADH dehydrogenase